MPRWRRCSTGIANDAGLPKIVALDAMATDGATMQALNRALAARGSAPCMLAQAARPMLASDLDGKQYLEQALSSGSRKKLRQHRRRLGEKGDLQYKIMTAPAEVERGLEDFLALEAAGWKGRNGTALASDPADAAYARAMIAALAARGEACIHALTLDGKPVSLQIVLRAGPAAFTWKTAYDEAQHDFSPGMLLLEDYTAAFLADPGITPCRFLRLRRNQFHGRMARAAGGRNRVARRPAGRLVHLHHFDAPATRLLARTRCRQGRLSDLSQEARALTHETGKRLGEDRCVRQT